MHNFLTEEDIKKMKAEIEYRKVVERKRLNEDVKEARAYGDLSENFEYKAAKRERGKNEGRIRYLDRMIKSAIIINPESKIGEVGLGKEVTVKFLKDEFEMTYLIVTTIDTDAVNNKISIESPLGRAIFKGKVGHIVNVQTPEGSYTVRIEKIKE